MMPGSDPPLSSESGQAKFPHGAPTFTRPPSRTPDKLAGLGGKRSNTASAPGSQQHQSFKRPRITPGGTSAVVPTAPRRTLLDEARKSSQGASEPLVYLCTWRKRQFKKHKSWDGDAYMLVDRSRHMAKLHECETDRIIASSTSFYRPVKMEDEFFLGGLEILVASTATYAEYHRSNKNAHKEENKRSQASSYRKYRTPIQAPYAQQILTNLRANPNATAKATTFYSSSSTSLAPIKVTSSSKAPIQRAAPRFDPFMPGAIVMKRPDQAHQAKFNPHNLPVVDVVVDPAVGKHLRPHQVQGVKFLYDCVMGLREADCHGAILADEMGLGKTLQTIALIHTLLKQSPYWAPSSAAIQKAVVVCPLTLVKNWKREFHKWLGSSSINVLCVDGSKNTSAQIFVRSKVYHVMIIGYEKLRSCMELLQYARPPIDLVVCDEGHRLKSRDAKTTKMFDLLPTSRRIILSGTPIQNDLGELHTMIDFVAPNLLGDYSTFKRVFEDAIVQSRMQGCTSQEAQLGHERSEMLRRATSNLVLRRTAALLTGYLPSRTDMVVFCSPSLAQLQVYSAILRSQAASSLTNPLVLIGLLRKLCDSTSMLTKSEGEATNMFITHEARRLLTQRGPLEKSSGKLAMLQLLLEQIQTKTDDKVVIVSHYTSALDVVQRWLGGKYPCVRLDGHTKQDERQALVNQFNRQPRSESSFVFLLSAKSGGTGLNLIGANRLVLLDSDWNPSTDQQAMARIHRDGQRKPCFIYRLLLSGTIDEKIFQRQVTKMGLSDLLLEAGSASSKNEDAFSLEELQDLFTLHTGTPCLTHDQLGCTCLALGNEAGSDTDRISSDEMVTDPAVPQDEDDLPGSPNFVPATQRIKKAGSYEIEQESRLASLFSWTHIDCAHSYDRLQDVVLQSLVSSVNRPTQGEAFNLRNVPEGTVLHVFQKDNLTLTPASV